MLPVGATLLNECSPVGVMMCRVSELLQGKGAGKAGRYQGKANSLVKRAEAESLLRERSCKLTAGEE